MVPQYGLASTRPDRDLQFAHGRRNAERIRATGASENALVGTVVEVAHFSSFCEKLVAK